MRGRVEEVRFLKRHIIPVQVRGRIGGGGNYRRQLGGRGGPGDHDIRLVAGQGESERRLQRIAPPFCDHTPRSRQPDSRRLQMRRNPIGGAEQRAVEEDRAQMNLDAEVPNGLEASVDQESLVEQARRRLDEVGMEPAGEAERVIGRVGRNPDPIKQPFVAETTQSRPHLSAERREEIARRLDHNRIGPTDRQSRQRSSRFGLDVVRSLIAARGLDRQSKMTGARHGGADHRLAMSGSGSGIKNREAGALREPEHVADFRLGRPSRAPGPPVQSELGDAQTEL